MKSDLIDILVKIHHETELSYLVSNKGESSNAVWVPKSQVELECRGTYHQLIIPEWLAIERKLI